MHCHFLGIVSSAIYVSYQFHLAGKVSIEIINFLLVLTKKLFAHCRLLFNCSEFNTAAFQLGGKCNGGEGPTTSGWSDWWKFVDGQARAKICTIPSFAVFLNSKRNGHIAIECKLFTDDRFDGLFGVILNGTIKQVLGSHSNKEHQYFSLSWVVCRWCPGQVHTFKISRRKLQSSSLAEVASTEFDNQASIEMVASNQCWPVYVAQTPATDTNPCRQAAPSEAGVQEVPADIRTPQEVVTKFAYIFSLWK